MHQVLQSPSLFQWLVSSGYTQTQLGTVAVNKARQPYLPNRGLVEPGPHISTIITAIDTMPAHREGGVGAAAAALLSTWPGPNCWPGPAPGSRSSLLSPLSALRSPPRTEQARSGAPDHGPARIASNNSDGLNGWYLSGSLAPHYRTISLTWPELRLGAGKELAFSEKLMARTRSD